MCLSWHVVSETGIFFTFALFAAPLHPFSAPISCSSVQFNDIFNSTLLLCCVHMYNVHTYEVAASTVPTYNYVHTYIRICKLNFNICAWAEGGWNMEPFLPFPSLHHLPDPVKGLLSLLRFTFHLLTSICS